MSRLSVAAVVPRRRALALCWCARQWRCTDIAGGGCQRAASGCSPQDFDERLDHEDGQSRAWATT